MTNRVNRAIQLLTQYQAIYYDGAHSGHVGLRAYIGCRSRSERTCKQSSQSQQTSERLVHSINLRAIISPQVFRPDDAAACRDSPAFGATCAPGYHSVIKRFASGIL